MSDETQAATDRTTEQAIKASEQAMKAFATNMEMGHAFLETWTRSLAHMQANAPNNKREASDASSQAPFSDATRAWVSAVTEVTRRTQEAFAKGETLSPDTYTDIWSQAASRVAQEIVKDTAFAKITGEWVNDAAKTKGQAREAAETRLAELGFATTRDIEEVGTRLIEMERRLHQMQTLIEDRVVPALDANKPQPRKGPK
ncbi:MAG: poly(R)-hydroxyalkanoic acid synthase subunit PhaE [Candidatus Thermoplasmatota archaeon]